MKVFAYVRVSGKGQVDGHGFDRQLDTIRRFCDSHGYSVAKVYREQVSGTKDELEREGFQLMVRDILSNGVNTIVVESLDRLAREYRVQEQLLIYLASKGINLLSANTGENVTRAITEDPMKKALVQIQGVFSELDKSLLVKKLRKAREKVKEEEGKCEGRKSYREVRPEILKEIQELRRKPKGKPRRSYREIAETLNAKGYTTMTGKPFTANNVSTIMHRMKSKTK